MKDWIATIILESKNEYSNEDRVKTLQKVLNKVINETTGSGVVLFPGGFFSAGRKEAKTLYKWIEEEVKTILKERDIVVCLGVDGKEDDNYTKDQVGVAINISGIIAMGRKFYPTSYERGHIEVAENYSIREENKSRVFNLNGKRYFICICYDCFGIKHNNLPNFGIDIVLDLVHGFSPNESEANFARHGFAGTSDYWKCHVFCATVFFDRKIPIRFPSGVYWDKGDTYSPDCTYESISLIPLKEISLEVPEGIALVRIYNDLLTSS